MDDDAGGRHSRRRGVSSRASLPDWKSKARLHKVILTGIMGIAVRYGTLTENPVRDTARMRRRKSKPKAIERDRLNGLRAQLREWLAGNEIPGTPAYTHGPRTRSRSSPLAAAGRFAIPTTSTEHGALPAARYTRM